jgi:hypothetical protein
MTTTYDIADMFLGALNAPKTPGMRRAVAIWLKFESGGNITGNNPWNLHSGVSCPQSSGFCPGQGNLPGQIGNRYAGPGDQNVAVFGTLNDGVKASAANLQRVQGAGYDRVVSQAQAGSPLGFLVALQQSKWSAGHYSFSKLTSAYGSGTSYNSTVTLNSVGGGKGGVLHDMPEPDLAGFDSIVSFPVGHVITMADVLAISKKLSAAGWFANPVQQIAFEEWMRANAVGKAWGKPLQDQLAGQAGADATNIGNATDVPGAITSGIAGLGGTIVTTAGYLLAVVVIVLGFYLYSKGTTSQETVNG